MKKSNENWYRFSGLNGGPLVPQTRLSPRKSQAQQSVAARRPQNGDQIPSIASRHGSLGYKMAGAV